VCVERQREDSRLRIQKIKRTERTKRRKIYLLTKRTFLPHLIQKYFKARKIKASVRCQLIKAPGKISNCLNFLFQGFFL
jgi:hypothetical protein